MKGPALLRPLPTLRGHRGNEDTGTDTDTDTARLLGRETAMADEPRRTAKYTTSRAVEFDDPIGEEAFLPRRRSAPGNDKPNRGCCRRWCWRPRCSVTLVVSLLFLLVSGVVAGLGLSLLSEMKTDMNEIKELIEVKLDDIDVTVLVNQVTQSATIGRQLLERVDSWGEDLGLRAKSVLEQTINWTSAFDAGMDTIGINGSHTGVLFGEIVDQGRAFTQEIGTAGKHAGSMVKRSLARGDAAFDNLLDASEKVTDAILALNTTLVVQTLPHVLQNAMAILTLVNKWTALVHSEFNMTAAIAYANNKTAL
jgi:hypothetical protein